MAHLGERIANSIVNRSFADLAALDVGDRNPQRERHRRRRQHLVTVGNQQQNVRPHRAQAIGKTKGSDSNRFGHAHIRVRTEQAFDSAVDLETVA